VPWVYENRQRIGQFFSNGFRAYDGVAQNARVIVSTVVPRAAEKVASTVAEAAKSVTGFFGRLFGGGASAPAQPQPTPPPTATPSLPVLSVEPGRSVQAGSTPRNSPPPRWTRPFAALKVAPPRDQAQSAEIT